MSRPLPQPPHPASRPTAPARRAAEQRGAIAEEWQTALLSPRRRCSSAPPGRSSASRTPPRVTSRHLPPSRGARAAPSPPPARSPLRPARDADRRRTRPSSRGSRRRGMPGTPPPSMRVSGPCGGHYWLRSAAMAARNDIIAFLDDLLDAAAFEDYGPNGLQVVGADEVTTVVTGVSAHLELFRRAAEESAEMVLCHHGMFWGKQPLVIDAQRRERLEALFASDMSLVAYHLPLDAHPEVGNNALICDALGLEPAEPFGEHAGRPVGFVGRAAEGFPRAELIERCRRAFEREPLAFEFGPDPVRSVGVISGGAASSLTEAADLGLDAFVTGEPSEPAMADARERGITFVAGGHWATETFGVRRLGDLLADRFGLW